MKFTISSGLLYGGFTSTRLIVMHRASLGNGARHRPLFFKRQAVNREQQRGKQRQISFSCHVPAQMQTLQERAAHFENAGGPAAPKNFYKKARAARAWCITFVFMTAADFEAASCPTCRNEI